MRILRLTVLSLFLIVLAAYILLNVQDSLSDKTYPIINADSDYITVPLNATNEDLLKGITAYDEKDGDITDKIIIESISRFTEPGVSVVRYAVSDNDRHVTTLKRRIVYENYVSPRFTVSSSLVFSTAQSVNLSSIIGAFDLIDGDISNKVIITTDDTMINESGSFGILVKATNSKGDTISEFFPVYLEERSMVAPEIQLKEYLVYRKVGESFDPAANVESALAVDGTDLSGELEIVSGVSESIPGVYEVHYRATDSSGRIGHVMMLVIIEA